MSGQRKERTTLSPTAAPRATARRASASTSRRTAAAKQPGAKQPGAKRPGLQETLTLILDRLEDMKAEETVTIDLTGQSAFCDAMVITSGRSNRHVGAVADRVIEGLKKSGITGTHVEGKTQCDWVLIDAGDVVVHVFRPEVRAFYDLEKMWAGGSGRKAK